VIITHTQIPLFGEASLVLVVFTGTSYIQTQTHTHTYTNLTYLSIYCGELKNGQKCPPGRCSRFSVMAGKHTNKNTDTNTDNYYLTDDNDNGGRAGWTKKYNIIITFIITVSSTTSTTMTKNGKPITSRKRLLNNSKKLSIRRPGVSKREFSRRTLT
jgi:hypothetical protein